MPIKASELAAMLLEHIKEYGDGNVMILDGYEVLYKTIDHSNISRNNNRFVIECEDEDF